MIVALLLVIATPARAEQDTKDTSVRKERNYIRQGNKLYGEKRYAEAEVEKHFNFIRKFQAEELENYRK